METHSMDCSKLQELPKELAKDLKTQADLSALTSELVKLTVETALNAELTAHLWHSPNIVDTFHNAI